MKNYSKRYWPFLVIAFVMTVSFWPFFSQGKIPVAGDILLGQYYPWLDQKWDNYSTIFPVLNNTIADSIFSFYPWKYKSFEMIKNGVFPTYEANTYMGSTLFATSTTGLFYPLNFLFLILDFNLSWGIISALTVFLSASFFYIWLRNKGLEKLPVLIVSIAYAFSSFIGLQVTFINTAHSVLWLPLILFSVDKLFEKFKIGYFLLLIFSLFASLNAGFFQGSLYIFIMAFFYAVFKLWHLMKVKRFLLIVLGFIFPVLLSAIQILPFLHVISGSSRLANYGSTGQQSEIFEFFVKPHFFLTTFFPDFFGNPGKGNYFGETNSPAQVGYFEFNNFAGTITILGFVLGLNLLKKQKEIRFFGTGLILSLIFATANPLSILPYQLSLSVISSLVPSRLLLITQFSLLIIAAYGLNLIYIRGISAKKFQIFSISTLIFYGIVVAMTYAHSRGILNVFNLPWMKWEITFRNTVLPFMVFGISVILLFFHLKFKSKVFFRLVLVIACFELVRQTAYFRPFIKPELIFPETSVTNFLKNNLQGNRFMILGQDLIPTNSQIIYDFKIVDGEGPIYPKKHGEFMAGINFENISDSLPQFRRMIYFRNPDTKLLGLLNIKYVVSSKDLENPDLKLVLEDGKIKIYENTTLLPRTWAVSKVTLNQDPVLTMKSLTSSMFNPEQEAIVSDPNISSLNFNEDLMSIENFFQSEGNISFNTTGNGEKLVVISEQYYPDWKLVIDGKESKPVAVDYNLLGVYLPQGSHEVKLKFEMESFKLGIIVSLMALGGLILTIFFMKIVNLPKKI